MRIRKFHAIIVVSAIIGLMTASLALFPGCGPNKEKLQIFVNGYLDIMEELESKPEIAQGGQQASMAYASSGYTDLESAEKARKSYEESMKNDKQALKKLDALERPDKEAEEIADTLYEGVEKVDQGNSKFASDLAKAEDQTVEERATTAQNIGPAMSMYTDGMTKVVDSLDKLLDYIKSNDLEGESETKEWHEQIKEELDTVKKYASSNGDKTPSDKPDLTYDQSASNPVIVYEEYTALEPKYLSDLPVVIIYGDSTVIKREDTYEYVTGKLAEGGLSDLLKSLSDQGYFGLKEKYEGNIPMGGTTEILIVHLKDKTYEVVAMGTDTPAVWDDIVGTVKDVSLQGSSEYFPTTVTLHASEAVSGADEGVVRPWPGDPADLERAVAASPDGIKLEGEKAKTAWIAVQQSGSDVFWDAGSGKIYGNVYTRPYFPGM